MAFQPGALAGKTMRSQIGAQPSVFDVASQESLMKSLKPALKHFINYLSYVNPQRFSIARKWYDELYTVFDLWLQNHFLSKYGASYSENFYGMKRIFVKTGLLPLTGSAKFRSILILVILPYLQDKLDALHSELKIRLSIMNQINNNNNNIRARFARLFVQIYPLLKFAFSAISVLLQLGYILNKSSIHSPFLWLSGTRLERLTPEDLATFDGIPTHLQPTNILQRLWRWFLAMPGVISRIFGYGLFIIQFVDFMYNSDIGNVLQRQNKSWNVPKAPHKFLINEENISMLDTNKCPICLKPRENSTALSASGYVFCYSCITDHIKKNGTCPITGVPAESQQLIRLYAVNL